MKLKNLIKFQKNQNNMESLKPTEFIMPVQAIEDLTSCYKDCDIMEDVLKKFNFTQPEKIFKLSNAP